MAQRDAGMQVPTLSTGLDGADSIIRYYQDGTDEVKNLLRNECTVIYECAFCRALFRSLINFISHKRSICRSLQAGVNRLGDELARQVEEEAADDGGRVGSSKSAGVGSGRMFGALRRFNLAGQISKHIRPIRVDLDEVNASIELQTLPKLSRAIPLTSIEDGVQVINSLPTGLAIKERVSDDVTVLVMPSDTSMRYREMHLRGKHKRQSQTAVGGSRVITHEDIDIIERMPVFLQDLADFQRLKCLAGGCKDIVAFENMALLARHLAEEHQLREGEDDGRENRMLVCFLCGQGFKSLNILKKHFFHFHQASPDSAGDPSPLSHDASGSFSARVRPRQIINPRPTSGIQLSPPSVKAAQNYPPSRRAGLRRRPAQQLSHKAPVLERQAQQSRPQSQTSGAAVDGDYEDFLKSREASAAPPPSSSSQKETPQKKLEATLARIFAEAGVTAPSAAKEGTAGMATGREKTPYKRRAVPPEEKLISSDEARKIDASLNAHSSKGNPPLVHVEADEDSGDTQPEGAEDGPLNLDQMDLGEAPKLMREGALAGRMSRRQRQPTKRYFNDETDTTIAKNRARSQSRPDSRISASSTGNGRPGSKPTLQSDLNNLPVVRGRRGRPPGSRNKAPRARTEPPEIHASPEKAALTQALCDRSATRASTPSFGDIMGLSSQLSLSHFDSSAAMSDFSLPPHISSTASTTPADKRRRDTSLSLYTPRAKRLRAETVAPIGSSGVSVTPGPTRRRKQNLGELASPGSDDSDGGRKSRAASQTSEGGEIDKEIGPKTPGTAPSTAPSTPRAPPPPKPSDLATVPVYLTEAQRDIFFAPLKPLFSQPATDGLHQCSECGDVLRCIRDGRRHMVSHLRIMRLRCSLCDAGAFFCSDMRVHLMYRHCEKMGLAPDGFVEPGTDVPCMDKTTADRLIQLVDPYHPGRVLYTSGKIVSWTNPKAYYPDAAIESRILGKNRPTAGGQKSPIGGRSSERVRHEAGPSTSGSTSMTL